MRHLFHNCRNILVVDKSQYHAESAVALRYFFEARAEILPASDIMAGVADYADSSVLCLHPSPHKAGNRADFCKATFYGGGIYEWEFPAQYA